MLKILLTFLVILDIATAILLVIGIIVSVISGGGSVIFPGLGLVVSLPLLLGVIFVFEIVMVGISIILYCYDKNSNKLI